MPTRMKAERTMPEKTAGQPLCAATPSAAADTAHQAPAAAGSAPQGEAAADSPQQAGAAAAAAAPENPKPADPSGDGHARPDIPDTKDIADAKAASAAVVPEDAALEAETLSDAEAAQWDEDLDDRPRPRPRAAGSTPAAISPDMPVLRIYPTGGWRSLDLREVWRYRELMFTLAWREISIRYKQTALGAAWAIIQPLMTTGIFSVLFGLLMGRGNEPTPEGIPYVVSTFCAMLPWQLFAHSLNQSGNILVQYRAMITKIYFPRLILPAAAVLSTLVDFAVALVALLVMMLVYGVAPSWGVVMLPGFVALALVSSLAVGLWLAAMNAIYRDFRYVIPFIVQIGMFISPVVYSTDSIRHRLPDWAMTLYSLNPMAGVIEGFRWALLGTARAPGVELALSATAATCILIGGMFYFRRMERTIADLI